MTCGANGALARICFEPGASPHTFDTNSEPYSIIQENVRLVSNWIEDPGLTGSRSVQYTQRRRGPSWIQGRIRMRMRPAELDLLLPRILGASEVPVDTFNVANDVPTFGILIDRVTQTFQYRDCKVARCIITGRSSALQGDNPQPIELTLDILGRSRVLGTSYPALTLGSTAPYLPYIFEEGAITLNGGARDLIDFQLIIDNRLRPRFVNSLTPVDICPFGSRMVMLRTTTPFTSSELNLIGQAEGGAAGSLVWTSSGTPTISTTVSFGRLQTLDDNDPSINGQEEIPLITEMLASANGATNEITFINDPVA